MQKSFFLKKRYENDFLLRFFTFFFRINFTFFYHFLRNINQKNDFSKKK